jgi:hypothetical protein
MHTSNSEEDSSGAEESSILHILLLRFDILAPLILRTQNTMMCPLTPKLIYKGKCCVGDHVHTSNCEGGSSGAEESFVLPILKLRFGVLAPLILRTQNSTLTSKCAR